MKLFFVWNCFPNVSWIWPTGRIWKIHILHFFASVWNFLIILKLLGHLCNKHLLKISTSYLSLEKPKNLPRSAKIQDLSCWFKCPFCQKLFEQYLHEWDFLPCEFCHAPSVCVPSNYRPERNFFGMLYKKMSPFEWVPEQLSRFLTDPTIAMLLEHPGQ